MLLLFIVLASASQRAIARVTVGGASSGCFRLGLLCSLRSLRLGGGRAPELERRNDNVIVVAQCHAAARYRCHG